MDLITTLALAAGLGTAPGTDAQALELAQDPAWLLHAEAPAAGPASAKAPARRLIVAARAGLPEAEVDKLARPHGGKLRRLGRSDLYVIELPPQASDKAVAALLARERHLKFVEADQWLEPGLAANDPYAGSQWHLATVGAPQAWDLGQGSGVTIAIIDSGVDASHPDLAGRLVAGWNFYDNNADTSDVFGHGTSVAGTAAASTNNGLGVAGLAGQTRIMPLRVSDSAGIASSSKLAQALIWAADNGARVANVSFSVSGIAAVQSAAQYLKSKGGLVVVSAGNKSSDVGLPQTSTLITVAATDSADAKASWSNYGDVVALAAPGASIWSTTRGGGYQAVSGTSFASPVVAGVAALVMAAQPSLSSSQVESLLFSTATDLGSVGRDKLYGWGRVNAAAAVQAALQTAAVDSQKPTVSILAPLANSTVSALVPVDLTAADNVGVSRVELYVNGQLVASDTIAPFAFSWDSSSAANGMNTLLVRAVDAAGNAADSAPLSVNVANASATVDTASPKVQITSPASGPVDGMVSITTLASDDRPASEISQTILLNGALLASGNGASLSAKWNARKAKPGSYTIEATAQDASGKRSSQKITVTR